MKSFETEIHGGDEEVGKYSCAVYYDLNYHDDKPDEAYFNVELFDNQKKPIGAFELTYNKEADEFTPRSEMTGITAELYPSVLLMLDEGWAVL